MLQNLYGIPALDSRFPHLNFLPTPDLQVRPGAGEADGDGHGVHPRLHLHRGLPQVAHAQDSQPHLVLGPGEEVRIIVCLMLIELYESCSRVSVSNISY